VFLVLQFLQFRFCWLGLGLAPLGLAAFLAGCVMWGWLGLAARYSKIALYRVYFAGAGSVCITCIAKLAYRLYNTYNKNTLMYYWSAKPKKNSNTKENQKMENRNKVESKMQWLKLADSEEVGFNLTVDEKNCYMNYVCEMEA
jgi:hypothetical protein